MNSPQEDMSAVLWWHSLYYANATNATALVH